MEALEEVKKWIAEGCNYNTGCQLYAIYGRNKTLSRLFPGRHQRYEGKLKYELCKSVGLSEELPQNKPDLSIVTIEENPEAELPEEMKKLTAEYSKLTADRAKLHARMSSIEGNDEASIQTRKELSDEIESLSGRLEIFYTAKEAFYKEKIMPDMEILFPVVAPADEKKAEINLPETAEDLIKMKKNIQTSLSKDRNVLEYQSETKLETSNPLPVGAKRLKIEKRIAGKLEIIGTIDLKLVDFAD